MHWHKHEHAQVTYCLNVEILRASYACLRHCNKAPEYDHVQQLTFMAGCLRHLQPPSQGKTVGFYASAYFMPQNVRVHDQTGFMLGKATDINLRRVYTYLQLALRLQQEEF